MCRWEYALNVDAIKNQLPSPIKVSLGLDKCKSTNKIAITSVSAYYINQNWALHEVQLTFNEVNRLFFSRFESQLRMIGQAPTYWSKDSRTFEGWAASC
jgi:hypothetical protein